MKSPFCDWLSEGEESLRGMISGAINYIFREFPEKVSRIMRETIGPVAIRLVRVLVVLSIWLVLVFWPIVVASKLGLSFWGFVATVTWLTLALVGSAWGRRQIKKRLAASEVDTAASSQAGATDRHWVNDVPADNNGWPAASRVDWESVKDCVAKS